MKQHNLIKTAAMILLSVCTIFVITYFSVFSAVHAEHAEHTCESHNCCICRQLQMAENLMKQLAQAQTPVLLLLVAVLAGKIGRLPVRMVSVRTLVTDKVRLDR